MPDSHRVRDSVDTSRIDTDRIDAERVDSDQAGPPGDPESVARIICLRLLDARPRTRAELATALRKRRVPAEAAAVVLDRFEEVGLIDDSAFARGWVTSRQAGRGLARGALAAELRRKGVPADTAQHALAEVDPELEAQTARAQIDVQKQSADLAAESLRLTTLRYQGGEATALEVVDAQNTLVQARNNYNDALVRYRLAVANLQTLTGSF